MFNIESTPNYSFDSTGGAPRKRGRPPGARAALMADARALGVHHFAFIRCSLLGLDLQDAFARYLEWGESTSDMRHIQHRRTVLFKQILDAGRQLDATLPAHEKITQLLALLRSDAPTPKAVELPTLEEWINSEGIDRDAWSEAELICEYKAAFGIDNADAIEAAKDLKDPAKERVKALNWLELALAVKPQKSDRLESWFARPVVKRLRAIGVVTLGNLVDLINLYGYRWHKHVHGFGERRATQVVAWLRLQADALQVTINAAVDEPKSLRALRLSDVVAPRAAALTATPGEATNMANMQGGVALQAVDRLNLSSELLGERGTFRSHMANTLDASNDLQAARRWLSRYQERPATLRSYAKEIERFMLWCTSIQRKPLSSITSPDCQAYRGFLQAVPRTWIHPVPVTRGDAHWRPFRGQPSAASIKQALVIVQTMFQGLMDAGYLVANPMRALMKGFDLPPSKIDLRRSFTDAEWDHVLRCVEQIDDAAERLRTRCLLELLVRSGVRLDELSKATQADLRLHSLPDLPDTWVLTVTGKRRKTREVPLADDVVALLNAHAAEFVDDSSTVAKASMGLILTIGASVPQWTKSGNSIRSVSRTEGPGHTLSAQGIYGALKRFFASAAKSADQHGLSPERFKKASTHWMRHTFVRQALADKAPLEVVSELVGHASLNTTSIYASQALERKVAAIRKMSHRATGQQP